MTPDNVANLQSKLTQLRRDAEERDAQRRATLVGYPYIDLRTAPISMEALKHVAKSEAKEGRIIPLQISLKEIAIAVVDPNVPAVQRVIQDLQAKKYNVKVFITSEASIANSWHFYEFIPDEKKEITGTIQITKEHMAVFAQGRGSFKVLQDKLTEVDFGRISTSDFFEIILAGALANKASDVHFEAEEKIAKVRFRIDGLLHDVFTRIPLHNYENMMSRIKMMSGLKINIREEAQDGRFAIMPEGEKEIEVRVSIIPSDFGETVVMRILDPVAISVGLMQLGLRSDDLRMIEQEIARPNGLLLNTGPTGSGKTTTLYAFLKQIARPEVKVITIEDPIEYRLPDIEQTQVDPEVGYTFASGLRSILRQDPNVVLVGEIRDIETADIAIQASLTGHLVFSTLHTNDAIGAVSRLVDLKVRAAIIGSALSLVIAQRLVRRLCDNCKKAVSLSPEIQRALPALFAQLPSRIDTTEYTKALASTTASAYEPVGCEVCNNFGYKGRVGIFEFLRVTPELGEAISKGASELALRKIAKEQELVTMQQDGILKILAGMTSFAEVEKATGPLVF